MTSARPPGRSTMGSPAPQLQACHGRKQAGWPACDSGGFVQSILAPGPQPRLGATLCPQALREPCPEADTPGLNAWLPAWDGPGDQCGTRIRQLMGHSPICHVRHPGSAFWEHLVTTAMASEGAGRRWPHLSWQQRSS